MTAEMFRDPDTATYPGDDAVWVVRCRDHDMYRRGLTQPHALNLVRKHDREDHAEAFQIGAVAALVLAAKGDLAEAEGDARLDPDKAWTPRVAQRRLDEVLAVWMTLLGLPLSEREAALDLAVQHAAHATTAHPAPF